MTTLSHHERLSSVGPIGHVVHEGWLIKSPSKPFVFWKTSWTKRYFVLMSGLPPNNTSCLLCFYDADKTKLRKQINLNDCEQVDAYLIYTSRNAKVKYDWIFSIGLQKNKRVHYFAAQTEQEMNFWVSLLCKACNLERKEEEEEEEALEQQRHRSEEEEQHHRSPISERSIVEQMEKLAIANQREQENPLANFIPLKSGGKIDTKRAKGYIPLTDCLSGPQRPNRKTNLVEKDEGLSNSRTKLETEMQSPSTVVSPIAELPSPYLNDDDVPPSFPPPPLPKIAASSVIVVATDDETSSDSVFIADDQERSQISSETDNSMFHKREKSNDSTISLCSLSNVQQQIAENSDFGKRSSSLDDGAGGSSSNISDTSSSATSPVPSSSYGNLWRSPPTPTGSDLLSVTIPPPRPPKRSALATIAQGFVSKEPELHLMYKNEISVVEESFENDGKYDKPRSYDSRSVERRSSSQKTNFVENRNDESYSSVKIPPVPVPRTSLPADNNNNENIYKNIIPSSPIAGDLSNNGSLNAKLDVPPIVDRSLKPNRRSPAISPKEFTPYIPSRLPPKHRSSNGSGGGPTINRRPPLPLPSPATATETPPMIDLSRKQSFTRRREGSSSSITDVKYGPVLKQIPRRREPVIVEAPVLPIQIDYLEVDSPSTSKPSTTGHTAADHQNPSTPAPQTPAAAAASASAGEAKLSYVLISEPKTQALLKTKFEQDRLYKKGGVVSGTLGRNVQI